MFSRFTPIAPSLFAPGRFALTYLERKRKCVRSNFTVCQKQSIFFKVLAKIDEAVYNKIREEQASEKIPVHCRVCIDQIITICYYI